MANLKKTLEDTQYELRMAEKKIESRGELIACLIFLVLALILILSNSFKNVDENEFCLSKLNKHFPEYDWYQADYCATKGLGRCTVDIRGTCKGWYKAINRSNIEMRDELEEVRASTTETKRFRLLSQKEIDYLESDNWSNVVLACGGFLLIISFMMFLCWLKVIK